MVAQYLRFSGRSARNVFILHLNRRKFSSSAAARKGSSWLKLLAGSAGVIGLGCGGMVGLSKYDASYRTSIEQTIPLSGALLSMLLDKPAPEDISALPAYSTVPEATKSSLTADDKAPLEKAEAPSDAVKKPSEPAVPIEPEPTIQKADSKLGASSSDSESDPSKSKKKRKKKKKKTEELPSEETPKPVVVQEEVPAPVLEQPAATPSAVEDVVDSSVDIIEDVINTTLSESSDPVAHQPESFSINSPEPSEDEAIIIMDALKTLDYEPVLSDTVLELLVGKAANREKAVVATISRLENAMASVVYEVQMALQHHNTIAVLVSAAKLKAKSVSEATDKSVAKANLAQLIESSAAVSSAFDTGEELDDKVAAAFNKLGEIIAKAEQFNLKGPVGAAQALLGKSKNDYYTSCQSSRENQVDHALIAHYQNSVSNRKKVLKKELAILQEHYPVQHNQLNDTFDAASGQRAQVDELNTLITYLSNKVGRLERDLEQQHASELDKLKLVAEAQKLEDAKVLEERLNAQKAQLWYEYEKSRHAEVESAVTATRDECSRQAERLTAKLKVETAQDTDQKIREVTAFWCDEAALRSSEVEVEYQCKLEQANKVLSGVTDMLDTQQDRYQKFLKYRRLLALTTALYEAINSGDGVNRVQLADSIDLIRSEYADDPLVSVITTSLPDSPPAVSFIQLKDRLCDLEKYCRRSALVVSDDCGIGSHILSYVMSALTIREQTYSTPPEEGGSITLYYIYKAQMEMQNNNLDLAARYVNQLVGKPKSIVEDWLTDARTLLELQQSVKLLMNYAKHKNYNS